MSAQIHLIGLDLDNTVLNSQKQLTPRVAGAIRRAIAAGIAVLPATGRPLTGVPPQFLAIPGVRYALCSNGAMVYDLVGGPSVLHSDCFTPAQAEAVVRQALTYDAMVAIYLDGGAFGLPFDYDRLLKTYPASVVDYIRATRREVPDLVEKIHTSHSPVEKVSLSFTDMDERRRAMAAFQADKQLAVTWSLDMNLELNTKTANKGTALLALGRRLGIPREGVMAVGDSTNDAEMLRAVGYAVAMGNAAPAILALADAVTATADEDGVADAIEAILPSSPA